MKITHCILGSTKPVAVQRERSELPVPSVTPLRRKLVSAASVHLLFSSVLTAGGCRWGRNVDWAVSQQACLHVLIAIWHNGLVPNWSVGLWLHSAHQQTPKCLSNSPNTEWALHFLLGENNGLRLPSIIRVHEKILILQIEMVLKCWRILRVLLVLTQVLPI